jgi:hypothetical protein
LSVVFDERSSLSDDSNLSIYLAIKVQLLEYQTALYLVILLACRFIRKKGEQNVKRSRRFVKSFIIVALSVLGSLLVALVPTTASAHTLHPTHAATYASPECNGSIKVTPASQSLSVNQTGAIEVNWSCEGNVYVVTDVVWADGAVTSYTCWANCSSGSIAMQHAYSRKGTYYPYTYMGGNASGFASVKIVVN